MFFLVSAVLRKVYQLKWLQCLLGAAVSNTYLNKEQVWFKHQIRTKHEKQLIKHSFAYLGWHFIKLYLVWYGHIKLDLLVYLAWDCIKLISGLIWPYKPWFAYLAWLFIKLYLAWYGQIKLLHIWHDIYHLIYIWLDMAISNLICISGIELYQVISGLIWPYQTLFVYLALGLIKLYLAWYQNIKLYLHISDCSVSSYIWLEMAR